jgi:arylsulfatase A-like enzyme
MKSIAKYISLLILPITLLTLSCKSGDTTSTAKTDENQQRTTSGSASDTAQAEQRVTEGNASALAQGKLSGSKPNIVFVLTDDQGMGDLSCMGNPHLKTPNIDSFYAKSSRFSDFHVSPTCSPTRAALMSGRHPLEVGVSHTVRYRERLAKDVITMPQALQQAGYQTGIFGKWHLGDEEAYLPQKRGFHEVLIHPAGGLCQSQWGDFKANEAAKYFDNVLLHNDTIVQTKGFCTDLFFDAGLAWTKKQLDAKQPFFTYISLNAPHGPMYAPEKNIKRFTDQGFEAKAAARYAMVENIDENFGKLMNHLEQWKALENTLVIFMTDNGMAMGSFKINGKKHEAHNAGMKGRKNSSDEGGTRVPSFWYWKGKTAEGVDIPALTRHLDLYRTFCELTGATIPESPMPPRGCSLVPLLENPEQVSANWPDRKLFVHRARWNDGRWSKSTREQEKYKGCAVRSQRWRLVHNTELYDISADPSQKNNVAAQHPEVVKEMSTAYDTWWDTLTPYLQNEDLPWVEPGEYHMQKRYRAQLKEKGIPDWAPDYSLIETAQKGAQAN